MRSRLSNKFDLSEKVSRVRRGISEVFAYVAGSHSFSALQSKRAVNDVHARFFKIGQQTEPSPEAPDFGVDPALVAEVVNMIKSDLNKIQADGSPSKQIGHLAFVVEEALYLISEFAVVDGIGSESRHRLG